jgi:ribulose-5-phosphate 4-epimerase/fuculose-1-phosphate aldolase
MNAVANKLHEISLRLSTKGLNHGATGNCSCRDGDSFLITPSGINNDDLNPNMMVRIITSSPQVSGDSTKLYLVKNQKLVLSFTLIHHSQVPLVFLVRRYLLFTI